MKLDRPICFVDLECTGVDRKNDRIIEISILKLFPDESTEIKTRRVNPGVPIPPAASEVHGIRDEDVAGLPMFSEYAKAILAFIDGCDMAGFNSNSYDFPLLMAEFDRAKVQWDISGVRFIDLGNIYKRLNPRDLSSAYKHYTGNELEGAHGAEADIKATLEIFKAQRVQNPELLQSIDQLDLYSNFDRRRADLSGNFSVDEEGNYILNIGANRGKKAVDHIDFVRWMHSKDFPADTLSICEEILKDNGIYIF